MTFRNTVFIFSILLVNVLFAQSWKKAQEDKDARITLFWYTSVPFIFQSDDEQLKGVEHDMLVLFQQYVYEKHGITLSLDWTEMSSFVSIIDAIRTTKNVNEIGVSAFSINKERDEYLQFTQPYLPDVTVLVSGRHTPVLRTHAEIKEKIETMSAVTIKGTTYESHLFDLQKAIDVDFEIEYIDSDQNILKNIGDDENKFGYIDLPIYLMLINDGEELSRQNLFTVLGTGYGFIMSEQSDWAEPFNSFLQDEGYSQRLEEIISKYLGNDLFKFIDELKQNEQINTSILTKEKEIQIAQTKNAYLKLAQSENYRNALLFGIIITAALLITIVLLFVNNYRKTKVLLSQRARIELQQRDIKIKNDQLLNRNAQLITLNEGKNNLVKVLAHDLRSQLNQIIGFSSNLQSQLTSLTEEQKISLQYIVDAGKRMELMISETLNPAVPSQQRNLVVKETIDIVQLISELIDRYSSLALRKRIDLHFETIQDIITIRSDQMLLHIILENLISNALDFSSSDTEVMLILGDSDGLVTIELRGQGAGLNTMEQMIASGEVQNLPDDLDFEYSSSVIGLSIVEKYIVDLGGQLKVVSEPEAGTIFLVSLPKS